MDKIFQYVCDLYPAYKIDTKFKKKLFYIFFSFFKFFLKGPFVMNFEFNMALLLMAINFQRLKHIRIGMIFI